MKITNIETVSLSCTIAHDIGRASEVRKLVGDDFGLVCTANQSWTPRQSIECWHFAEDFNSEFTKNYRTVRS